MKYATIPVLVLALALLAAGCGQARPAKEVSLKAVDHSIPNGNPKVDSDTLRVAIAAVVSPKQSLKSYTRLLEYIEEKTGRTVQLIQKQTYAEVNALMRAGKVDLAFVCTNAYVLGQRDGSMELLASPQVNGEAEYYAYIIVPGDSRAKGLEDLRGTTFAFSDPLSTTGRLVPEYVLNEMGESSETFFRETIFTFSHDNSIKAVAEHLVDGASVDSLVYTYAVNKDPDLKKETKVIAEYGPYATPPVVVYPSLDPAVKDELKALLLNLDEDELGREILSELGIDRFVSLPDSAYDSVRVISDKVGSR